MSQATIDEILNRIKELSPEDRLLLDEVLAREEEREWLVEADSARRAAREKGLDQAAIDRAVYAVRHGG